MLNEQDTHSGCIIFESKTGIPITPYKECMIDGSELPNATVARVLIQGAGMAQRALASHQICVPGSIIFLLLLLLLSLFICNGTGGIINNYWMRFFVISRIIKVEIRVISRSRRLTEIH